VREYLKLAGRVVAVALAFPAIVSFAVRSRLIGPDRALEGSSQWLSLIPGIVGLYLRNAFLRHALLECSPTATVSFGTLLSKAGARIGDRAYVGPHCHLGLALIEPDVLLGAGVHVTSGRRTHGTEDPDRPIRDQPGLIESVTIGQGAWIGSNAVVMADVGAAAVVAAGAVVVHPVPPGTVVGGVPARILRDRTTGPPQVRG
jgi:virginiamycin A acetyltransferase